MPKTVFYTKCRPQGCDALEIAKESHRVFIGYPVKNLNRDGNDWRRYGCRSVFRDLLDPDWDPAWTARLPRGYKSQVTLNRNLAARISKGSIVLVPRPAMGKCFAAELTGPFELVDQPAWADAYIKLRKDNELAVETEGAHIGDVCQTWPVREWVDLPFTAVPRWISYRLLSRNTVGEVRDLDEEGLSVWETLSETMRNPDVHGPPLTHDIERALLNWLSPAAFEHLVVSLLQLETENDIYWHHVGGSGDGGVDGIAVDSSGLLCSVLQCKWSYSDPPDRLFESLEHNDKEKQVTVVVAILRGVQCIAHPNMNGRIFWNRTEIARLVEKHKAYLPIAKSLGLSPSANTRQR